MDPAQALPLDQVRQRRGMIGLDPPHGKVVLDRLVEAPELFAEHAEVLLSRRMLRVGRSKPIPEGLCKRPLRIEFRVISVPRLKIDGAIRRRHDSQDPLKPRRARCAGELRLPIADRRLQRAATWQCVRWRTDEFQDAMHTACSTLHGRRL